MGGIRLYFFKGGGLFFLQEIAFLPQKRGEIFISNNHPGKIMGHIALKEGLAFPLHLPAVVFAITQHTETVMMGISTRTKITIFRVPGL